MVGPGRFTAMPLECTGAPETALEGHRVPTVPSIGYVISGCHIEPLAALQFRAPLLRAALLHRYDVSDPACDQTRTT